MYAYWISFQKVSTLLTWVMHYIYSNFSLCGVYHFASNFVASLTFHLQTDIVLIVICITSCSRILPQSSITPVLEFFSYPKYPECQGLQKLGEPCFIWNTNFFPLFPFQQGWNITVDLVIGPKGIRQMTSKEAKVSSSAILQRRVFIIYQIWIFVAIYCSLFYHCCCLNTS